MEASIKRALLMRSTVYKNIEPSLLSSLEHVAEQHVLDAKGLAAAFDKFMTVARWERDAVIARSLDRCLRCERY